MEQLTLKPIRHVDGQVQLPGSKSLSLRLLLLSSMARGSTQVNNLLDSDDTQHMETALRTLGVSLELSPDRTSCQVEGLGGPFLSQNADLFLGNSGTGIRPLCAALCLGQGTFTLTGEPRMLERPIAHLVDALRKVGANITYLQTVGNPPVKIDAAGLAGGRVSIRGNISSQYLTALLLAAPLAQRDMMIEVEGDLVSKPYIDMTLDVMRKFGITVERQDYSSFRIPSGLGYESPGRALVEGDASSATYFLSAAAIKGGTVRVTGVGGDSVQGDIKHADVLAQMGATVRRGPDWIEVSAGDLHGVDLDLNHMPDAAMTVAATALFAHGKTTIRNLYNLRVKESDRLTAMATELRKLGAKVVEGQDYLEIDPPKEVLGAAIDTYNDHRMAMSFALAAMGPNGVTINDPACVSKTFPDYFEKLTAIAHH